MDGVLYLSKGNIAENRVCTRLLRKAGDRFVVRLGEKLMSPVYHHGTEIGGRPEVYVGFGDMKQYVDEQLNGPPSAKTQRAERVSGSFP